MNKQAVAYSLWDAHTVLPARPRPMKRQRYIANSSIPRFAAVLIGTCLSFEEYACIANRSFVFEFNQHICVFWAVDHQSNAAKWIAINPSIAMQASKYVCNILSIPLTCSSFLLIMIWNYAPREKMFNWTYLSRWHNIDSGRTHIKNYSCKTENTATAYGNNKTKFAKKIYDLLRRAKKCFGLEE